MNNLIADNLQRVQAQIAAAAARSGRPANAVTLIAVSKGMPAAAIAAAYAAGARHFGENRADELARKVAALDALTAARWHFIGQLQTRQSAPVAELAHAFHAVDRLKIAERLARQLAACERTLPVWIEVNVSGEASKAGFDCRTWESDGAQREALAHAAATIAALPRIEVRGLMTMAPYDVPEAVVRAVFSRTRQLAAWLQTAVPHANWSQLSMGMTDDYAIAIEEGATHVRVGRAIFGERTD